MFNTHTLFKQWLADRVRRDWPLDCDQTDFMEECWEWTNRNGPSNCWSGQMAVPCGMIRGLLLVIGAQQQELDNVTRQLAERDGCEGEQRDEARSNGRCDNMLPSNQTD